MREPIEQFRDAIRSAGLEPPEVIEADGKLRRFASNGKRNDDAGWYALHDDGIPAGSFGDWRSGISETWRADIGRTLTPAEEAAHRAKVEIMRREREAEETRRRAEAAKQAKVLVKAGTREPAGNPYLARKGVSAVATLWEIDADKAEEILGYRPKASGKPLVGRLLVAPVKVGAKLSTCELIDEGGHKSAIYGGAKAGGYWAAQPLPEGDGDSLTLLIGEGVATVLSAKESSGHPAIAALSAGNLPAVAKIMRERYPAAALVILADLVKATGAPDQRAIDAAQSVGALLAIPNFGTDRPEDAKDFNDMHRLRGAEAVARAVAGVIESATGEPTPGAVGASVGDPASLDRLEPPKPEADPKPTKKAKKTTGAAGKFEVNERGVFFTGDESDGGKEAPRWICSSLHVVAQTRDGKSNEWGRLLEWRDADKVLHQWAMPLELLQGDGVDVRRELARLGLMIAPGRAARDLLASYLQVWPVTSRARCVDRLGWQGAVYVTPAESIGEAGERVVFQNAHALEPAFSVSGTADEWRNTVARLVQGNSRLVFSVSVAFAGPLANVAGEESGGFHWRGKTSIGKTTGLKAAASTWGDPVAYPRVWRATANGLEGLAALHNDGLLILDELSQIDPKEAGEAAYLLANGQGKARAARNGTARQSARWRLLFLSAGEESLSALMMRVGRKVSAGQEIRLADIEADAGVGMGAFEALNGCATPAALALAVKDAATRYHGAVGVVWLRAVVKDRDKLADLITGGVRQFVSEHVPVDAAGQVLRVARRFGLVAVAGELATHYGLTGWPKDEATTAAGKCFAAWLESFGGEGNREDRALLAQVRAFLETHGASRFEDVDATHDQRIINRAGFFRTGADTKREFLVLPEAFKRDMCAGFDVKAATRCLIAHGWIAPGGDGRATQKPRLPGIGTARVFVFTSKMWEGDE